MYYAITKPIEEYVIPNEKYGQLGLYLELKHRPTVLAATLLFNIFGFGYERDDIPHKTTVALSDEGEVTMEETLKFEVEGKPLDEHLRELNPVEIYELLDSQPDEVLEKSPLITRHCQSPDDFEGVKGAFMNVLAARAVTWADNFRGVLKVKGKKVPIFRGVPVTEDMREKHDFFIGVLTGRL